jgi:primosomal replication protein N
MRHPDRPPAPAGICREPNLFDFFHEQVEAAVVDRKAPVSSDGVVYLSTLLVERSHSEEPAGKTTLVELHIQAAQADRGQQVRCYKDLGDRALFVSGFFAESLRRSTVGVDYYVQMGQAAYDRLAHILSGPRRGGGGLDKVFAELAESFGVCVEVLREVREGMETPTDDIGALRLYEQYLTTGSRTALRKLHALGLAPQARRPAVLA